MNRPLDTLLWDFVVEKILINHTTNYAARWTLKNAASRAGLAARKILTDDVVLLLLICFLCGLVGAALLPFDNVTSGAIAGVFLVFLLCFVHPALWQRLLKVVISIKCTVVVLLLTTFLTLVGTVLIQNGSLEQYTKIYGDTISQAIFFLGFHDLFQSPVFSISLTLLWMALVVLLCKRIAVMKIRQAGLILMHAAIVVILGGGFISRILGEKGVLPLSVGQTSGRYELIDTQSAEIKKDEGDRPSGLIKQLPFSLRLDDFDVSYYDKRERLYLYDFDAQAELHYPVASWSLSELKKSITVLGYTIRIRQETASAKGGRILEIEGGSEKEEKKTLKVAAGTPEPIMLDEASGKIVVFEPAPERVREYLSRVALTAEGRAVGQYEIRVNQPLSFDDYTIYQSSYDPDRPDFSVFQIVYDPGLPWVYAGLFLLFGGVLWMIVGTLLRDFLVPFAALGALLALGYAISYFGTDLSQLPPALQSVWFVPHIVSYFLAYGMLALAVVASVVFLNISSLKVSSEQTLSFCRTVTHLGFYLLTIGLITGAVWGKQAWGDYWTWDPKESWALISWLVYLVGLHAFYLPKLREKWCLRINMMAFGAIMFTYLGLHFLPSADSSKHVYGEGSEQRVVGVE